MKEFNVNEFENSLAQYMSKCLDLSGEIDKTEAELHFQNLLTYFEQIVHISIKENKIKGTNEVFSDTDLSSIVPKTGFYNREFDFQITVGLFREFYVVWKMDHCGDLGAMNDSFWQLLFELFTIGELEFIEGEQFSPEIKRKHKHFFNKRGNFFRLLRTYFISQIELGESKELGQIVLRWDYKTDKRELIQKYIHSIGVFYKLHKLLLKENKGGK